MHSRSETKIFDIENELIAIKNSCDRITKRLLISLVTNLGWRQVREDKQQLEKLFRRKEVLKKRLEQLRKKARQTVL